MLAGSPRKRGGPPVPTSPGATWQTSSPHTRKYARDPPPSGGYPGRCSANAGPFLLTTATRNSFAGVPCTCGYTSKSADLGSNPEKLTRDLSLS